MPNWQCGQWRFFPQWLDSVRESSGRLLQSWWFWRSFQFCMPAGKHAHGLSIHRNPAVLFLRIETCTKNRNMLVLNVQAWVIINFGSSRLKPPQNLAYNNTTTSCDLYMSKNTYTAASTCSKEVSISGPLCLAPCCVSSGVAQCREIFINWYVITERVC